MRWTRVQLLSAILTQSTICTMITHILYRSHVPQSRERDIFSKNRLYIHCQFQFGEFPFQFHSSRSPLPYTPPIRGRLCPAKPTQCTSPSRYRLPHGHHPFPYIKHRTLNIRARHQLPRKPLGWHYQTLLKTRRGLPRPFRQSRRN